MIAAAREWAARAGGYFWDNPVFLKEMRLHFRSNRIITLQAVYLLLLGALLSTLVYYAYETAQTGGRAVLPAMGQSTFRAAYSLHIVLLGLLLSSLATSSVSSEREAHTWELLEALPMGKGRFVSGKFWALLILTALVLTCSLPVFMLALSYVGGVTMLEWVSAFFALLGLSAFFASSGILASSSAESSRKALTLWYRVMVLVFVLTWLGRGFLYWVLSSAGVSYLPFSSMATSSGMSAIRALESVASHAPILRLVVWPMAIAFMVVPTPQTVLSSWATFAIGSALAAFMLAVAADQLRAADEKRPYQVLLPVLLGFLIVMGLSLLPHALAARSPAGAAPPSLPAGSGITRFHRRAGSSPAPLGRPGLDFLLLQGTLLFLIAPMVTANRPTRFSGWRGFFSGGPVQGAMLLVLCLAAADAMLGLASPAFSAPVPGSGLPPQAWLDGTAILGGMIVFWSGLASACLRLSPLAPRATFLKLQLALLALPFLGRAWLPGPAPMAMAPLFALNPWLALAVLDPRTSEAVLGGLRLADAGFGTVLSVSTAFAAGAALHWFGAAQGAERPR